MPRRTRKFRGARTHGRGKKHGRGAGGRGGKGNAGLHKHKFKWMVKYDPDHFGRHGFVRHAQARPLSTINLDELLARIAALEGQGHARRSNGGMDVDLTAAGIDKLLGRGRVGVVLKVTVARASETAVAKVAAAGGQVMVSSAHGGSHEG